MRRLTLIRHGLTEGNVRRWYYGALDLPLCEAGADALREAAAAGLYPPIGQAKILTSGLLRTEQTLRLLYGDVPHEAWPELREISFGIFEGKSYDELNGRADYAAWLAGDWFGNVPPGGESFAQAQARILAGLARMQAQREDILAVVHGGTVLTIMQALFPEEEKNGYEWQPRPGGGYRLDLEAHTWTPIGIQP
ncbi:MAG: histidine phosphatase family protein [Clostridiales bacterium]|nr:histidine phosphatase family protein [Clostridiales bacterium]